MKLLRISKEEAKILYKEHNVPFGENGISHTWAKNRHYYLCESDKNMNKLEKIRRKQLVETFE
jgi:hypothetical protein